MAATTSAAAPGPVNLNALGSDDFAIETAEMRFSRRHGGQNFPSHDDPAPAPYAMQEGVWRPDGKGANETIYQPFFWGGRKVRALKPAPKTRPGEQWSFPQRASDDHQIGILTGDARYIGNEPLLAGQSSTDARRRLNKFQALQRHNKNPGLGGAMVDGLYGLDEETAASGMRLDQVKEALAGGAGGNAAQARPVQFMQADIDRQILAELERVNHDAKAMQFLLDPEANAEYNTLAMGAAVTAVNTTGDYNLGVDGNLLLDRGTLYLTAPGTSADQSAAPRAGAAMSDTLNAVKVRTADMQGINTWGADDSRALDLDGEDGHASEILTHSKDQAATTHVLFNRSSRGPETGLNGETDMDAEQAPLAMPRRYRRKEQDRGFVQASAASEDQDGRDAAPLSMARRYRRKEQAQGAQHASLASDRDLDGRDAAPLSMARRYRRKEQDQGAQHASLAGDRDLDGRDAAPLSMARAYRRKEQDQGAQHASLAGDRDLDGRDAAPLSMARRYRRKEVDRIDGWLGVVGMDVGDTPHRMAAPRKRETNTAREMTAALLPGAGYDNAGEVMGQEPHILAQVPSQEARGVERAAGRKQFGMGVIRATETVQYEAQTRIDPSIPETLSRSTQQVNLRDRRAQQTQISVRGYDEMGALEAAYTQENGWIERGRGRLGQPLFYESADESGAESGPE
jgi:hypothetical protein